MKKPINVEGTAILPEDQYRGGWKGGLHKGAYPALVQAIPIRVYRDNDLDSELDMDKLSEPGWFGINHHRMHEDYEVEEIGPYSAGCQVRLNNDEHVLFMYIYNMSKEIFGERITYTLVNKGDF